MARTLGFGASRLRRWAYRLLLMASFWILLAGLNLAYLDVMEGKGERAAGALALCISAMVLAVSAILGQRLMRRHHEHAFRVTRLEDVANKLARVVLSLADGVASQAGSPDPAQAAGDSRRVAAVATPAAVGPPAWQRVLELGIEVICTRDPCRDGTELATLLAAYRRLIDTLRQVGQDPLAARVEAHLGAYRKQLRGRLRAQFADAVRDRHWDQALRCGGMIRAAFPDGPLAEEFGELEPRLLELSREADAPLPSADEPGGEPPARLRVATADTAAA